MNALLEDAAAEYVARHTGGTSAVALKSFAAAQSSYQSPTTTYRSLSESGLGHEDIINQLGGGPAPTEGEVQ